MEDFGWTTGNDPSLVHIRKVDHGASAEVHEVLKSFKYSNDRCEIFKPIRYAAQQFVLTLSRYLRESYYVRLPESIGQTL